MKFKAEIENTLVEPIKEKKNPERIFLSHQISCCSKNRENEENKTQNRNKNFYV